MNNNARKKARIIISAVVISVLIPACLIFGVWLFKDRKYNIISMLIAFLSCVPFFVRLERGKNGARELIVIAVMTAFSVLGRIIFMPLPGFKPVTAVTVISGITLGPEAGFLVGSLTAVVSDFFFGQGPWTPFQMFAWGILGFLSGILMYRKQKKSLVVVCVLGAAGGVLFSLIMDIWTTLSLDGVFNVSRYLTNVFAALPFMGIYSFSNIVFLLLLTKPFVSKLERIKVKYGIFV